MAIVKILSYPDPRLCKVGAHVDDVNAPGVQSMIQDMFDTLYATPNCAGLASTQLDFAEPKAITVIDFSAEKNNPLCLINPEIIASKGDVFEAEGCMSVFPCHVTAPVRRAEEITVKALNEKGEVVTFTADGFMAKCIQHECDHLQGKLYIDRVKGLKRKLLEKKILKARKKTK